MSLSNNSDQDTSSRHTLLNYFTPRKGAAPKPQSTTPGANPPEGGGRASDGSVLYGRVAPFQVPDSMLVPRPSAQKRKPVPEDGDDDDDHDMLGKDIPTIFKRPKPNRRQNSASENEEAPFATAYSRFLMFDGLSGAFPSLALGAGPQTFSIGNLPILSSGFIEAQGSSQDAQLANDSASTSRAKKTTNPSRARRTPSRRTSHAPEDSDESRDQSEPVVDEETGMGLAIAALRRGKNRARPNRTSKRVRMSEPPESSPQQTPARQSRPTESSDTQPETSSRKEKAPATSQTTEEEQSGEDAMATEPPAAFADKGKGRADSGSGYVTRAELDDIQYSLRQLNNNVGRLVVLMGEQTQFFSTMQARGWRGTSPTTQPQHGAADEDHGPGVDVSAAAAKLRRRAAHDPKPNELPTSRDPEHNALAARIRKVMRQLMGRQTHKDPFYAAHIASDTEAEEYDPEQGPACGLDDFRPDLTGTPANAWNASVIQTFIAHYMALEPEANEEEVTDLVESHVKYLCNRYKESLQGEEAARRRQKWANRAERQRNLWVRRLTVAAFHPDLQIHIPILRALGPFGMSSDESDHESASGAIRYRILRKPWRSPDLTLWLRLFDKLYAIWRLANTAGAQPHPRYPSNVVSARRPPVRGLPWNAYNKAWFEKLTDYDKNLLAARIDETYNFTHPIALRNQAGSV